MPETTQTQCVLCWNYGTCWVICTTTTACKDSETTVKHPPTPPKKPPNQTKQKQIHDKKTLHVASMLTLKSTVI